MGYMDYMMGTWIPDSVLPLAAVVGEFSLSPQRMLIGLALICPALALAASAIVSLVRRDRAQLGPTTRRLCREVGVGVSERRLLDHLARGLGVPSGASLLVSRGCFDAAVARAGAGQRRRLAAVRRRVFG